MVFPIINTKAMNVELTKERKNLISLKIAPIARLVPQDEPVVFDVVIRKVNKAWFSDRFCISVRMQTETGTFYAIATELYLEKAFSKVREDLRRSISKSYNADAYNLSRMQRYMKERQYLELFA